MRYYSTNATEASVSLKEAIMRSIAPDGGVYMPLSIPLIPKALFKNIAEMSLTDIAYVAASVLFSSDIEQSTINDIVKDTLNFPIPLVQVSDNAFALELFHGPTGSFKDVGARFMARLIRHYHSDASPCPETVNVLVATSGDTGCAVANSFANVEGVNVFVFHPKGKLLRVPSEQFLSPAPNIIPVTIRGSFDDCQKLVRDAFADEDLCRRLHLTSANSINIARLLPQTFYFFHAYARVLEMGIETDNLTIATPCGNLGNLTAALFAKQMGLPINRILAAGRGSERLWGEISNRQLAVNTFNSRSLSTNLARINRLMTKNAELASIVDCHTYGEDQTACQIKETYEQSGYLMDRNSAMARKALSDVLLPSETGIFLATAHPAKYSARLHEILGYDIAIPSHSIAPLQYRKAKQHTLPAIYSVLRNFLLDFNV